MAVPTPSFNSGKAGTPNTLTTPEKFDLKKVYTPPFISPSLSILLQGEPGVGKTRLLATAPLPLLIYSFDPKGILVLHNHYQELIDSGMIQYITYWGDDSSNPTEYLKWEKDWEEHVNTGYLSQFGTVSIDSFTTWMEAAANAWLAERNTRRKDGKALDNLAIGDYPGLYNLTRTMIKRTSACDVNFILTAHLEAEKDELTGLIRYVLSTYKGLKTIVPPLFSEKWVMNKRVVGQEVQYSILTNNQGLYTASTQLKGLDIREQPNIKNLLKKAGLPYNDKPAFWKE